jgi:hypothetical protein
LKKNELDNKSRENIGVIPGHQIGAVIRAYLKNKRDTLAEEAPTPKNTKAKNRTRVSELGKRILLERMVQRIAKKAQTDITSIPDRD